MKISVFTNMMPTNIQEHIYSTVEKDTQYTIVKKKAQSNPEQVGENCRPVPMDIG